MIIDIYVGENILTKYSIHLSIEPTNWGKASKKEVFKERKESECMDHQKKQDILQANGTFNKHYHTVKKIKFLEDDFYDPMDIIQVKYEMLRDAGDKGRSITEIAKDFGFSRAAYYVIKEAFEQQGMTALFPQKTGPKQPRKLTAELQIFIDEYRKLHPNAKILKIADAIFDEKGISISRRTIERYINKKN